MCRGLVLPEGAQIPVHNVSAGLPHAPCDRSMADVHHALHLFDVEQRARSRLARSTSASSNGAAAGPTVSLPRSTSAASGGGNANAHGCHAVSPPPALSPPPLHAFAHSSRHASVSSPARCSSAAAAWHSSLLLSKQNSQNMSSAAHAAAAPAADAAADVGRARVRNVPAPPGTVIGDFDWVLHQPRSFQCVAETPARVLALTRNAHAKLAIEKPEADGALLRILLRLSQVSTAHALVALDYVK